MQPTTNKPQRCEARLICQVPANTRCSQDAQPGNAGEAHLCYTHSRAARNPEREVPLELHDGRTIDPTATPLPLAANS